MQKMFHFLISAGFVYIILIYNEVYFIQKAYRMRKAPEMQLKRPNAENPSAAAAPKNTTRRFEKEGEK